MSDKNATLLCFFHCGFKVEYGNHPQGHARMEAHYQRMHHDQLKPFATGGQSVVDAALSPTEDV